MNSLTTQYRRSQLIALPMPGGREPVPFCYAVNVPGDREIVTHEFAEWAVGDWREEAAAQVCTNLTGGSAITTACPSKLSAGSQKPAALSICGKVTITGSVSVRSSNSSASSGK